MKRTPLIITAVLVLMTALIAFFYLKNRHQAPEGNLAILYEDKETRVDPFSLPLTEVKGTTVNGKGEQKEISEEGVTLSDVLSLAGISKGDYSAVRVVSSDEYAAEISAEEIDSDKIAFLIRDKADNDTELIRLIVFGDSNSKRQVKDVVRIEVIK